MEPLDDFETRPARSKVAWGHVFFFTSLLTAVWFLATAWFWVYLVNLVLSYPVGALSLILWAFGRNFDPHYRRYRFIALILICGLSLSLAALLLLLAFN